MIHKTLTINLYFGENEKPDIDSLKEAIEKCIKAEIDGKNAAYDFTTEELKKCDMPPINWPPTNWPSTFPTNPCWPKQPLEPGDTPDTFKWQPTCNGPYHGL